MGPQAKKTYSRKKNDIQISLEKNKENVDPFDELLASPLKQDVSFKPLSYWRKKSRVYKAEKKSKHDFNNLFKINDSDELTSPDTRWVKPNWKILKNMVNKQDLKSNSQKKKKKIISTWKITDIKNDESSFLAAHISHKSQNLNTPKNMCFIMARKPYAYKTLTNDINFNEYDFNKNKALMKSCETHNEILRAENSFALLKIECSSNVKSVSEPLMKDKNIFATSMNESSIPSNDCVGNRLLEDVNKDNSNAMHVAIQSTKTKLRYSKYKRDVLKCFEDKNCTLIDDSICKENSETNYVNSFEKKSFENQNYTFEGRSEEMTLNEKWQNSNNASTGTFESYIDYKNVTKTLTSFKNDCSTEGRKWNSSESPLLFINCKKISDRVEVTEKTLTDFKEKADETINETLTPSKSYFNSNNSSSCSGSYESQVNDKTVIEGAHSPSNVAKLTSLVSNLTISNDDSKTKYLAETEEVNAKDEIKTTVSMMDENPKNNSSCTPFKNITLRRGAKKSNKYLELRRKRSMKHSVANTVQHSLQASRLDCDKPKCLKDDRLFPVDVTPEFRKLREIKNDSKCNINKKRNTLDVSRLSFGLGGPVFESTRVEEGDVRLDDTQMNNEDSSILNFSIALKPGKQWLRSLSVLRHLQNNSTSSSSSKTEVRKGRNYANFVEEVSKLQNCSDSTKAFGRSSLNCTNPNGNLTVLNRTVKVMNEDTIIETNSSFAQALGLMPEERRKSSCIVSARDYILNQCDQDDIVPFEEFFNEKTLPNCRKIGEGVYGEVFRYDPNMVFKIMPIEGDYLVNGERQKKFEEILSEIVVAMKLSNLRFDTYNQTACFCELKKCWCVYGKYPEILLDCWNDYNEEGEGSENDSPEMFEPYQIYIILEFGHGGNALERFIFSSAEQSYSILSQIALSLAVAEKAFEFEHRDLHWGNILVSRTREKYITIILDDVEYNIPAKGVKVCIIDYTLSRVSHEGCTVYNNLSEDPSLFVSIGDYQFEIYRMMKQEVENEWWQFKPRTNLYWLHYVIDKLLNMSEYRNTRTVTHKKYRKRLQQMESIILRFKDSCTFAKYLDLS